MSAKLKKESLSKSPGSYRDRSNSKSNGSSGKYSPQSSVINVLLSIKNDLNTFYIELAPPISLTTHLLTQLIIPVY